MRRREMPLMSPFGMRCGDASAAVPVVTCRESDIQVVDETDPSLWGRISGERMGAPLHRLGLLGEFLASGSKQVLGAGPFARPGPYADQVRPCLTW